MEPDEITPAKAKVLTRRGGDGSAGGAGGVPWGHGGPCRRGAGQREESVDRLGSWQMAACLPPRSQSKRSSEYPPLPCASTPFCDTGDSPKGGGMFVA